METTFGMKRRPFGDHFKGNWRPLAKISVVLIIIGSKNFRLLKMALFIPNFTFCIQFSIFSKQKESKGQFSKNQRAIIYCKLKGQILLLILWKVKNFDGYGDFDHKRRPFGDQFSMFFPKKPQLPSLHIFRVPLYITYHYASTFNQAWRWLINRN